MHLTQAIVSRQSGKLIFIGHGRFNSSVQLEGVVREVLHLNGDAIIDLDFDQDLVAA